MSNFIPYVHTSYPTQGSAGSSATARAEFDSIANSFSSLPATFAIASGAFSMVGLFPFVGNLTGATNITFPTSGTLLSSTGTIGTASSISGGTAGTILWQSGVNTTAFTAAGIAGQVLISNGATSPTWNGVTGTGNFVKDTGAAIGTPTISAGTFTGGGTLSGTFTGGTLSGSTISAGTYSGGGTLTGTFTGGTLSGSTFSAGTYSGGGTLSGTFSGGTLSGNTINAGTYTGGGALTGTYTGGTLSGNTISSSTLNSCTINTGTFKDYTETPFSIGTTSATTINYANGGVQYLTTSANCTITLPAAAAGRSLVLWVLYGGAHTITFAGGTLLKPVNGINPTATSVLNKWDKYIISCLPDGTATTIADGGRAF